MQRVLVYDWPVRFFHWTFAALATSAFLIAQTVDSETNAFSYHMILGLTLAFVAVLRIIWGFVGSYHARFSSFPLSPGQAVSYFKELFQRDAKVWVGHNPASSWTAIVMLIFAPGLATTGVLMTKGVQKDVWEDVHELLANGFLVAVIAHVGGVVFHMLKHRDALALSMVNGQKQVREGEENESTRPHLVVGLAFLGLTIVFLYNLARGYNPQTRNLQFLGTTLQLGEAEENEQGAEGGEIEGDDD